MELDVGPEIEEFCAELRDWIAAEAPAGLAGVIDLPTLDQTRKLARLEFFAVPARLIGSPGDGVRVLRRTLYVAAVALAAEQLGGARRALDVAVKYAKVRYRFGRPIGSFQAIKHRCADLLLEVESLRSAVRHSAAAVAEGGEEVAVVAPLLKAYASETYFHMAAENIQIHGGIDFTWEHNAHLYFKRANPARCSWATAASTASAWSAVSVLDLVSVAALPVRAARPPAPAA